MPATGGTFTGPIRVPNNTDTTINNGAVLNYSDIKTKIVNLLQNNALLYTWIYNASQEEGELKSSSTGSSINSVSIITGLNADVEEFAQYNYINKKFAYYIYISTDNGNIYFGTSDSNVPHGIKASELPEYALKAGVAGKLETASTFSVNLESSETQEFDGSKSETPLGVLGILQPEKGGTGTSNLSDVTVGKATKLEKSPTIQTKLDKSTATTFEGDANIQPGVVGTLQPGNGGTGKTDLSQVTVGKATVAEKIRAKVNGTDKEIKVVISSGDINAAGYAEGDIWIKYS